MCPASGWNTAIACGCGVHAGTRRRIASRTGRSAAEFARDNLFGPLGIRRFHWPADAQGNSFGWGDLRLVSPDLARIGYLFLHGGRWGDRQVVPKRWVKEATRGRIAAEESDKRGSSLTAMVKRTFRATLGSAVRPLRSTACSAVRGSPKIPSMLRAMAGVIGKPELTTDPRFAAMADRKKNEKELVGGVFF